ncbi:hypothetical protein Mic7113_2795 [Allocoleopsis franciscana PCC 7113]|uniref:Uncharacterized protein n=1 Tax=Allocoleopsis franciscana PCC 7113 TaxID=1173027 RepID=K9WEF7_9CYAN|nr:hypothetical protein Mic7113_2795 [Allocoleopsis franciscana PCC 7113]
MALVTAPALRIAQHCSLLSNTLIGNTIYTVRLAASINSDLYRKKEFM